MTTLEKVQRLNAIIDELNALEAEKEDLPLFGATDEEMALDFLRDSDAPTIPDPDTLRNTCAQNLQWLTSADEKRSELFAEYQALTDAAPDYHDATNRYARSFRERL